MGSHREPRLASNRCAGGALLAGLAGLTLAGSSHAQVTPAAFGASPFEPLGKWTLSAGGLQGMTDMESANVSTSVDARLHGASVAASYALDAHQRLSLKAGYGETRVKYRLRNEILKARSHAIGMTYEALLRPVRLEAGASVSRDRFYTRLQNSRGQWDGGEREWHVEVSAPLRVADRLWATPLYGVQYVRLRQDRHELGASIFPKESRTSRTMYGGVQLDLFAAPQGGAALRPWLFAGFIHENAAKPLQGPSPLVSDRLAGNHYTVFTRTTRDVPRGFAGGVTKVVGAGLSFALDDGVVLDGAYHHDDNRDYASDWLALTLRSSW